MRIDHYLSAFGITLHSCNLQPDGVIHNVYDTLSHNMNK